MRLSNDIWDRSRFCWGSNSEKSETGPIPCFWYILIKFCIIIDMIWTEGLPNLAQEIVKWHLTSVEAVPSSKFWKSEIGRTEWTIVLSNVIWDWPRRCRGSNSEKQWNWPYLLKLFEYFDKIVHKHCYWRELDRGIAKCHLSSVEALQRSRS